MKITVVRPSELQVEHMRLWSEIQRADPELVSPFFCPEFTQAVAAVYASDGCGADGSGLDLTRGAVISCAAMATAPEGLKNGAAG